jgi:hypothetical protein
MADDEKISDYKPTLKGGYSALEVLGHYIIKPISGMPSSFGALGYLFIVLYLATLFPIFAMIGIPLALVHDLYTGRIR